MTGADALTIAAAQPCCAPHDITANASSHAEVIRAADARVVAFPELSLTGYELDASPVDPADERLFPIVDACAATGSVALVGAPTSDTRGDHISVIAVDASGARVVYRKMWLSDTEAQRFVPGPSPAVVAIDGWRLGLAICKDTGIPAHADATSRLGMDAYVAGVLDSADDAAVQDERARWITTPRRMGRRGELRRFDGRWLRDGGRAVAHLVAGWCRRRQRRPGLRCGRPGDAHEGPSPIVKQFLDYREGGQAANAAREEAPSAC